MSELPTILVVDDEQRSLESIERILEDTFEVRTAATTQQAEAILDSEWVQVILCDQRMPDLSGVDFLKQVRDRWPDVVRLIISGHTDAEDIIDAINEAGIYQYVTKPWQPEGLILTVQNAARMFALRRENELLNVELKMSAARAETVVTAKRLELRRHYHHDDGIFRADNSPMNEVCDRIARIAPYDISVLVTGESGTGKELVARALHYASLRWNKPFVVENCAALPTELLESELFGHKRGAFTGAIDEHVGLFQRADGGTVFLDEIGDVSPAFQVKLLRVLQEGEIRPVGSRTTRKVDIRVIAATNKDLETEVRAGRFREDLFYRLSAVALHLPPLRERRGDVPILAKLLLDRAQQRMGKEVSGISGEAMECLSAYHWPGNVREMQNELQQALIMAADGGEIGAALLSSRVRLARPGDTREAAADEVAFIAALDGSLRERVESVEARIIRECLMRHRWNKSRAAKELGLSRVGLRAKLERYGLEKIEALNVPPARRAAG